MCVRFCVSVHIMTLFAVKLGPVHFGLNLCKINFNNSVYFTNNKFHVEMELLKRIWNVILNSKVFQFKIVCNNV